MVRPGRGFPHIEQAAPEPGATRTSQAGKDTPSGKATLVPLARRATWRTDSFVGLSLSRRRLCLSPAYPGLYYVFAPGEVYDLGNYLDFGVWLELELVYHESSWARIETVHGCTTVRARGIYSREVTSEPT